MYFSILLVAAVVSTTTLAASLRDFQISIANNCQFVIYTRTDYNGGGVSRTHHIQQGEVFQQPIRKSGAAIHMEPYKNLTAPLTLRYTPIDNIVYYDLSNHVGPPFIDYGATVIPSPYPPCSIASYSDSTSSNANTCQLTGYWLELCGANPPQTPDSSTSASLTTMEVPVTTTETMPIAYTSTSASSMTMPSPITTTKTMAIPYANANPSFITMPIPVTMTSHLS